MPGRLLPTIRSRCRMLRVQPPGAGRGRAGVWRRSPARGSDAALQRRAAELSGGSVRHAFKILDEGTLAIVEHIRAALDRLPAIDWTDLHAVAEGLTGRVNEAAFETTIETIFDWLGEQTEHGPGRGRAALHPLRRYGTRSRARSERRTATISTAARSF